MTAETHRLKQKWLELRQTLAIACSSQELPAQVDDDPDRYHFHSEFFATPIPVVTFDEEIPVTAVEVSGDLFDEGAKGVLRLDSSPVEFNEFGDDQRIEPFEFTEHTFTFRDLEQLTLRGCRELTSGCIDDICKLQNLNLLKIGNTALRSDSAKAKLQAALADCKIE